MSGGPRRSRHPAWIHGSCRARPEQPERAEPRILHLAPHLEIRRFGGRHPTIKIRDVSQDDAAAITAIYAHHVLHGTASYEIDPPPVDDTLAKIRRITGRGWPFLVVTLDSEVVGYAYAEQLRDRPAYRYASENSIYVRFDRVGRGIGKALLTELCGRAEAMGFRQMIAVIGGAEPSSIALHESCGFDVVGRLSNVGWKKGRWLDTVYMQRSLGAGSSEPGEGPSRE